MTAPAKGGHRRTLGLPEFPGTPKDGHTMKIVIEVKELKVDLRGLAQLLLVWLCYFH